MRLVKWFCVIFILLGDTSQSLPQTTNLWQGEELIPVTKAPSTASVTETTTPKNITCLSLKINETCKSTEHETSSSPPISSIKSAVNEQAINARDIERNTTLIDKLSHQVRIILKHFQGPEPIGIPGQTILTEPLSAPDTNASLVLATGYFYNITIWGLSNFTINVLNTKLDDMEVYVELLIKRVLIEGNYSVKNLLVDSGGPFNITMINVTAIATVDLATDEDGRLFANKSVLDMTYKDLEVELSDISSILRPFVNGGGAAVLRAEKGHMLANVNERLLQEMDRRLAAFPRVPALAATSPVDLAVAEARKFVRWRYEPYTIASVVDFENAFVKVHAGPVTLRGVSRFARVGDVSLALANATVAMRVRVLTGRVDGNCRWSYDFGPTAIKRHGESNFTVAHVQFEAAVEQPVDSRRPPRLASLEVETGPIRVRMDGHGRFDYLVEMVVKFLPKMLRYTIIDALEEPVRRKVQSDILDKISVDRVVEDNMDDIKKYLSDKL